MTKKILNLHRMHTNNVGDLRCAPYLYFADLLGSEAREILGFRQADEPDRERRLAFAADFAAADIMVIGGGGLLEIDFFTPFYKYLAENRQPHQKTVIWGAGHNSWVLGDWRNLKQRYSFDPAQFDLIGIRDADEIYPWVPCVSCMSPAFDAPRPAKREVGVYAHVGTINNENFRKKLPSEFDILDNSASFEDAVDFLGSSELVLTDSFHGAYWATLMGRKVVGFPSSSKFYSMKHAIPLCAPEDWKRFSKLAQVYDEALDECRGANTQYAQQVAQLIHA